MALQTIERLATERNSYLLFAAPSSAFPFIEVKKLILVVAVLVAIDIVDFIHVYAWFFVDNQRFFHSHAWFSSTYPLN